jgi:hypothetical protein
MIRSLSTISRNVPSGDNLCMSLECNPHMYTLPCRSTASPSSPDMSYLHITWPSKLIKPYPKVYIYKDYNTYEDEISFTSVPCGITVVPCTDKAVVTLPWEKSIQFINTTNNTKDCRINHN